MIVFYDGGAGLLPVLLLFGLFLLLPLLLFRSLLRTSVRTGPWPGPPAGGGWDVPREPALPRVDAADVVSLRDRLGHDVRTLDPGSDPVSRQALADASERLSTCTALLDRARTDAQLRTAWLAAVEGLTASRLVRERAGLDLGPEIPLPPSAGQRLRSTTELDVAGRRYVGGPVYTPGRSHWFPGGSYDGRYVPGGWYDAPFWPSGLVLGALGGFALGGLAAGAMFADGDGWAAGPGGAGGWDGGWGSGDGGAWDTGAGDRWDGGGGFGGFGGGGGWDGGGGGWGDGGGGGAD